MLARLFSRGTQGSLTQTLRRLPGIEPGASAVLRTMASSVRNTPDVAQTGHQTQEVQERPVPKTDFTFRTFPSSHPDTPAKALNRRIKEAIKLDPNFAIILLNAVAGLEKAESPELIKLGLVDQEGNLASGLSQDIILRDLVPTERINDYCILRTGRWVHYPSVKITCSFLERFVPDVSGDEADRDLNQKLLEWLHENALKPDCTLRKLRDDHPDVHAFLDHNSFKLGLFNIFPQGGSIDTLARHVIAASVIVDKTGKYTMRSPFSLTKSFSPTSSPVQSTSSTPSHSAAAHPSAPQRRSFHTGAPLQRDGSAAIPHPKPNLRNGTYADTNLAGLLLVTLSKAASDSTLYPALELLFRMTTDEAPNKHDLPALQQLQDLGLLHLLVHPESHKLSRQAKNILQSMLFRGESGLVEVTNPLLEHPVITSLRESKEVPHR
jgi:hypothetical protein